VTLRIRLLILLAGPVMYLTSCSSPSEPPMSSGRLVLRFEPPALSVAGRSLAAASFDSVAVSVWRPGTPPSREVRKGLALDALPADVEINCIAEAGKRVSVDLFEKGTMLYHGYAENVSVRPNTSTPVPVEALPFRVSNIAITPVQISDGETFGLAWSSAAGAEGYKVQSSRSADFSDIEWETSVDDTTVSPLLSTGTHYFRVAPVTPYVTGTFSAPDFGYVLGGGGSVAITGFSAPGVVPGDEVTILGENLDYPGTQAAIGALPAEIVSMSWGAITIRAPRKAKSGYITVTSSLGNDISKDAMIALRFAYVTASDEFAASFAELVSDHGDDVDFNGVVVLPLSALDSRDMSVFDVIVVANDTGTDVSNWGGGVPARIIAITSSGANVIAMGDGGAAFVRLAVSTLTGSTVRATQLTSCYVSNPGADLFKTPHGVTGGLPEWVDMCQSPERAVSLDISSLSKPSGVTLYASTGIATDRWVIADAVITDAEGTRRYLFWGYAADPRGFTPDGENSMANAVTLLYNERVQAVPTR
jgi:hypothetical protein